MSEFQIADTCNTLSNKKRRQLAVYNDCFSKILEFNREGDTIIMRCGNESIGFRHDLFSEFILKMSDLDWEE
jgi:hypothetical protein